MDIMQNIGEAMCMKNEEKKAWVEMKVGTYVLNGVDDDCYNHTYRAMYDYGMSFGESNRWAWLNTLFGYDIGADHAKEIINWYDNNGLDVYDLEADESETVETICRMELGFYLNFNGWPDTTPRCISYTWPDHLQGG